MREARRAVSPVIGVILMVAIVVVLAAFAGTFVLGIGSDQVSNSDAGPYFATDISKEVNYTAGCSGSDSNKISLTYDSGDNIPLEDIEIQVTNLDTGDAEILHDLPIDDTASGYTSMSSHVETASGSGFIWSSVGCTSGPIIDRNPPFEQDRMWSAGETIGFQLTSAPNDGDTIKVTIVDIERNSQIDSVEVTYLDK